MRRLIRSEGYARARLASAALFIVLGGVVAVRGVVGAGVSFSALPACVLGAAMIALGALRFRDYAVARRPR